MFNRMELKGKAKTVLSNCYWPAVIVSLVLLIVTGSSGSGSNSTYKWTSAKEVNIGILGIIVIVVLAAIVIAILLKIFIGYTLEVGGRKFFLESTKDNVNVGLLSFGFSNKSYRNIVRVMFIRSIITFAWGLLFIIPGIIKYYSYRMVPYILAENPGIDGKKALELSALMTQGNKWDIFILDLSFFWWYVLGSLFFGIGIVFVMPYVNMTHVMLYQELRQNISDYEDASAFESRPYDED